MEYVHIQGDIWGTNVGAHYTEKVNRKEHENLWSFNLYFALSKVEAVKGVHSHDHAAWYIKY